MKKEIIGLSIKFGEYFLVLEDDTRLQVDKKEFQKIKNMLSRNNKYYIQIVKGE